MMKTVHYEHLHQVNSTAYLSWWRPSRWDVLCACGAAVKNVTKNPDEVTCVSCKMTKKFRDDTGRKMPPKAEERSPKYVHLKTQEKSVGYGSYFRKMYTWCACGTRMLAKNSFFFTDNTREVTCPRCLRFIEREVASDEKG